MKKSNKENVETIVLENSKTGETLELQHEQHKAEYGAKHFWKADKKFFELLSMFSAAESKVLAYILQKTQPTKNEFIGAYKTIARKLNCDVTTVRSTFKKMTEKDMLAKTDNERIWMLNPRLLVKGDIIVQARLMSKYDTLLKRPLSNLIITDDAGNDPVFLPIEYPTPESLGDVKSDFFRVFDSLFETLSGLGGKESEVLYFLVCAMQTSNNTYIGPMKEIAVNVNCSKATVQRAMETLAEKALRRWNLIVFGGLTPLWLLRETAARKKYLRMSLLRFKRSMTKSENFVRMAKSGRKLREKRKRRHRIY